MADKPYPESGAVLYRMIVDKIDCERITLDLDGVVSLPSMFLNVSIGRFIEVYGVDMLKKKISFSKITSTQAERIKSYVEKLS